MIDKVNNLPIERLYFLESNEFLEEKEQFYLKNNKTFKLNSYWLGISKVKVNNDKLLFLFNGLRGYYDVRSRFFKKPDIKEVSAPLSKIVYYNDYLTRKYLYPDLIIYSLDKFNRPTITLKKDAASNLYYDFPYRLIDYLNTQRELIIGKSTFAFWKKEFSDTLRHLEVNLKLRSRRKKKKNYRRLKLNDSFVLGYYDNFFSNFIKYNSVKLIEVKKTGKLIIKKEKKKIKMIKILVKIKGKTKVRFRRRRKYRLKKMRKFYKTNPLLKLFLIRVGSWRKKIEKIKLRPKKKIKLKFKAVIKKKIIEMKNGKKLLKKKKK